MVKFMSKIEIFAFFCHVFAWHCKLHSICFWLHEMCLVWSDEVDIMMNIICKDHVFQAWVWWWKCLSKWWWRKYVKTMNFKHWYNDEKVCEKTKSLPIFCLVFVCYCRLLLICSWLDEMFLIWSGELDIMVNKIS